MATALKFVYNSVETNFDEDEILDMKINNISKSYLWRDMEGYFHLYKIAEAYKKLTIIFSKKSHEGRLVQSKIKTLWEYQDSDYQPAIMKCYYEYLIDTSSLMYVQMKRDDYNEQYIFGKQAANNLKIVFFEAVPVGVAI